jgi:alanyl-tRNA synthetase
MPAGEPGGPDSEVFYEFNYPHDKNLGNSATLTAIVADFLEIGNSVFMNI